MTLSLGLMVLGSLAIGMGAMVAISRLHQNLSVAIGGYRQLRQLYDVGFLASKARDSMNADPPRPELAKQALLAAQEKLKERSDTDAVEAAPLQWVDESARRDCLRLIARAITETDTGSQSTPSLNPLFARMSKISGDVRQSIVDAQAAADRQKKSSLWFLAGLCTVVLMAAVTIGVRQYRRVVGPVRKIGDGARAFATGQFTQRIAINADREFVALADDFNHMANELASLYQTLEQKVRDKTRELVRSEQLAGVGYLAAGVAHEINNPLGIIAGYGEHALAQLNNNPADSDTQKALKIICEEAFRCKQITDRLLSLAGPGSKSRRIVSIATIAETVISTLAGLGTVGARSLTLDAGNGENLNVLADEGEIKQVLLNLIINAMDAVGAKTGQIRVKVARGAGGADGILLTVTDNGQGMTAETLDKIFQPFFTEKRGQRHGTGLGLSIAHAIVTDHGGRIWAQSAGPNLGSVFSIELPAADKEVDVA